MLDFTGPLSEDIFYKSPPPSVFVFNLLKDVILKFPGFLCLLKYVVWGWDARKIVFSMRQNIANIALMKWRGVFKHTPS